MVAPALAAVLRESRDGMRNFFPLGMLTENIGSNRGLLLLLKDLYGSQLKAGHYSFLLCGLQHLPPNAQGARQLCMVININECVLC